MRISDWSSDVCSSDLPTAENLSGGPDFNDIHQDSFRVSLLLEPFEGFTSTTIYDYFKAKEQPGALYLYRHNPGVIPGLSDALDPQLADYRAGQIAAGYHAAYSGLGDTGRARSEGHTSELQSLMRISSAVFCLKKKT